MPSKDVKPQTRPSPSRETLGQPRPAKGKPNDLFADREGNVVKRDKDGFQARDKGGWSKSDSSRGLDRDVAARDRATQRSQSIQRPSPKSQPQARPPQARPQPRSQPAPRPSSGGKGARNG